MSIREKPGTNAGFALSGDINLLIAKRAIKMGTFLVDFFLPLRNTDYFSLCLRAACLFCLAGFFLGGCASMGIAPASSRTGPVELEIGNIIETASGDVITFDDLIRKLSGANIVYVGETHTSVEDHKTQLKILRQLADKWPCIELGMEMFPREAQPVLDRYARGEMTEEEFLTQSQWERVWGFPFGLYRGIMEFAKEKRMRIGGLNAPQPIVRSIARGGLASLTPEERARVAVEFHLDDAKNRLRIQKDFTGHVKEGIKSFDSFFEAQLAWEETMAETLAERLEKTGGKCGIVVIVGKGHMTERHGIPYLTALRRQHVYRTVASVPINYPFSAVDPNIADYVILTDVMEPFHRPRLGVSIQVAASGAGVEILDILPASAAARADLRKGDIILSIDGKPMKTVEEVQRTVAEGGPAYEVLIQRDDRQMKIDVSTK